MPTTNQQAESRRFPVSSSDWLSEEEIVVERMRSFHQQRVDAIQKREKPLCLGKGGALIVHLIPVEAVRTPKVYAASVLKEHGQHICSLGDRGGSSRFNADGFLNYNGRDDLRAYTQLYRDGRLEAAMSDASFLKDGVQYFRDTICERALIQVVGQYVTYCKGLGVGLPVWLFASLTDVDGAHIYDSWGRTEESGIDRPVVHLPETEIATFEIEPVTFLRPLFDCMWNALGAERSWNYDEDGNRKERQRR